MHRAASDNVIYIGGDGSIHASTTSASHSRTRCDTAPNAAALPRCKDKAGKRVLLQLDTFSNVVDAAKWVDRDMAAWDKKHANATEDCKLAQEDMLCFIALPHCMDNEMWQPITYKECLVLAERCPSAIGASGDYSARHACTDSSNPFVRNNVGSPPHSCGFTPQDTLATPMSNLARLAPPSAGQDGDGSDDDAPSSLSPSSQSSGGGGWAFEAGGLGVGCILGAAVVAVVNGARGKSRRLLRENGSSGNRQQDISVGATEKTNPVAMELAVKPRELPVRAKV